jgi:hypothetical protein
MEVKDNRKHFLLFLLKFKKISTTLSAILMRPGSNNNECMSRVSMGKRMIF